ncbi:hypothetical protein [Glycomyces salinus]|uniref:hypothetical protein n=1 Tax=Glycomyces salinus TaxID=980294 RepID=UPI0018ED16FD|nr:hypothetical protein [Glycomyces salinus]
MSDDELNWQDNAPSQSPTVAEDGAWGGQWKDYYDATTGEGSRKADFDGQTSGLHQWASQYVPDDGNESYTNTHQGFGMYGNMPAHLRYDGDTVGSDVRVSGRNDDGSIAYDGRSHSNVSGNNMLQSAASPLTLGINTFQNAQKIDSLTDFGAITNLTTSLAGDLLAVGDAMKQYTAFVEHIGDPKFDPVQWLAGTLIDFLIQAFQPLEDLVGLVSGNESRMKKSAEMWGTVAEGAAQVGDHVKEVGVDALSDWVGQDGDTARVRVEDLGESTNVLGYLAVALQALLTEMANLAKMLRQDIVDLIAKGVSWALTRLLPQAAAAVATFGAWTAGMVAQGVAKIASLIMRALNSIKQVLRISERAAKIIRFVLEVIDKLKPVLNLLGNLAQQAARLWV